LDKPQKFYFKGNAAKSRVMSLILEASADGRERLILDYGCGRAAYWPKVLGHHPHLSLAFFDPHGPSMAQARRKLAQSRARALTDPHTEPELKADFVVSFSVLEHVRDRRDYLTTAFRHLKPGGTLFLNYDDGHFRNSLSLNRPWKSKAQIKEFLFNITARPLAALGVLTHYQSRVRREDADRMIKDAGFEIKDVFYSNMPSLKGFYGEMEDHGWDEEARTEYAEKWQEMEDFLNERLRRDEREIRLGDRANLWPHMLSRTLVCQKPA